MLDIKLNYFTKYNCAHGWSAGMEQSATRDSDLLLTFEIPKGDQVSPLSSVIWLTVTVHSDRQRTSVLSCATVLDRDLKQ